MWISGFGIAGVWDSVFVDLRMFGFLELGFMVSGSLVFADFWILQCFLFYFCTWDFWTLGSGLLDFWIWDFLFFVFVVLSVFVF